MIHIAKPHSIQSRLKLVKSTEAQVGKRNANPKKALFLEDDESDAAITKELLEKCISPAFKVSHKRNMTDANACAGLKIDIISTEICL